MPRAAELCLHCKNFRGDKFDPRCSKGRDPTGWIFDCKLYESKE